MIKVQTHEITRALRILGQANRRSGFRNVNLAGRLMASFAQRDTKEAGESRIRAYMLKPARNPYKGPKARGRNARIYQGTVAAAIVGSRARGEKRTGRFYQSVNRFVRKSERSTGYHRAGNIEALKAFRAKGSRRRGRGRFRGPIPGRAKAARASQKLKPHAFMENRARGIAVAQPNIYRRQVGPVARQLIKFAREDLIKARNRARLR